MSFNINEYQNNYKKEKLERLSIDVKKGKREELKEYAKSKGKSINQYVKDLIKKDSGIDL